MCYCHSNLPWPPPLPGSEITFLCTHDQKVNGEIQPRLVSDRTLLVRIMNNEWPRERYVVLGMNSYVHVRMSAEPLAFGGTGAVTLLVRSVSASGLVGWAFWGSER